MTAAESHSSRADAFDADYDVIVAGYGFAGGAAAIAASDAGARVLLVEKMPDPGGISICAGGGVRIARSFDDAYAYLRATNAGTTPDDVLEVIARGMTTLDAYVRELAAVNHARLSTIDREGNYPYPGYGTFQFLEVDAIPGFDATRDYPQGHGLRKGANLFKVVQDNVDRRPIDVRLATAAQRLIMGAGGEVAGVVIEHAGRQRRIKARRGVVLACGGFEADHAMQRQYWNLSPVLPVASR